MDAMIHVDRITAPPETNRKGCRAPRSEAVATNGIETPTPTKGARRRCRICGHQRYQVAGGWCQDCKAGWRAWQDAMARMPAYKRPPVRELEARIAWYAAQAERRTDFIPFPETPPPTVADRARFGFWNQRKGEGYVNADDTAGEV